MSRKVWIIFIIVQTLGLICSCVWVYDIFGTGPAMWLTSFISLLPGDFVSGFVIEKLLWNSGLTLGQMGILEIPIIVAVNACISLLCVKLVRAIKGALKGRNEES